MNAADTILSVHEPSARSDAAYALSVDTSFVASEAGESSRKWRPAPGELVSLWDMLRFQAHTFVALMNVLSSVEHLLKDAPTMLRKAVAESGLAQKRMDEDERQSIEETAKNAACAKIWETVAQMMDNLEKKCREMELRFPVSQIEWMRGEFNESPFDFIKLEMAVGDLERRVIQELQEREFFFVHPDRAKYLDDRSPPFGNAAQDRFPEAIADIVDASWCLGIERSTAAVYHLMRVVEFGIRRLAKRLKLPKHLENRSWGDILGAMNTAIGNMPYGNVQERKRRDQYSEAVAHLNNVKDAWRNPTMHSKRRYTQEEAEAIFGNVKTFTNFLATKIFCR